jgi:hypothetical protein
MRQSPLRGGTVNITSQPYNHDRTIVTVAVLVSGTALLILLADQSAVIALVSSMFTLALTFWFRLDPDATL